MSIFHPSVYPKFKDPVETMRKKERNLANREPEPQPRRSSSKKKNPPQRLSVRQSYKLMKLSLTKKQ